MLAVGLAPLVSKTHTGNIGNNGNSGPLARVMSQRGGTRSFAAVLISYPLLAKMQLNWGVVNKA